MYAAAFRARASARAASSAEVFTPSLTSTSYMAALVLSSTERMVMVALPGLLPRTKFTTFSPTCLVTMPATDGSELSTSNWLYLMLSGMTEA